MQRHQGWANRRCWQRTPPTAVANDICWHIAVGFRRVGGIGVLTLG
ncbi:hypothetical protein [Serratia odorifera]|uniref:Uncharacterized protein n=1 Tax=Serratia odorifera DSM 4582 TaxID=667129 RepID=D4E4S7_SEROD|nr:hypothetical protein [Serratia odorifera]EFE95123.1 hypothetical protein HMPREF0758_3177 [Serratia odorifera DSM 4582]